jgi:hypothetical protein
LEKKKPRFNVIDALVILIILAIVAGGVYRVTSKRINARQNTVVAESQDIYVTLFASLVVPEVAESLKPGDKLVANNRFTDAEVVSVESVAADYVGVNSDGLAVLSKHPIWKDVTVVIKDKADPNSVLLKAGNQEVRVGYSFILKTQTVETNARIRGIEFK